MSARTIKVPRWVIEALSVSQNSQLGGAWLVWPVQVDWPELRLTEEQQMANAVARASDQEPPYPDHSIFSLEFERLP